MDQDALIYERDQLRAEVERLKEEETDSNKFVRDQENLVEELEAQVIILKSAAEKLAEAFEDKEYKLIASDLEKQALTEYREKFPRGEK